MIIFLYNNIYIYFSDVEPLLEIYHVIVYGSAVSENCRTLLWKQLFCSADSKGLSQTFQLKYLVACCSISLQMQDTLPDINQAGLQGLLDDKGSVNDNAETDTGMHSSNWYHLCSEL
jgi:hypothetical protein